ncbi:1-(5-phosphoribosyl)-5-[(5-phosphoribosylamino)methylideneamino]imidazole-4-carboxamide isomerase [Candidatus Nitrosotenuis aquarius]|uniref:1-(5-phosphoribosyl)-5-[(5- phosphoribosylamino)methylideneamino]imidazole-4- carboxamide isomerase n=1 Tax=Candidatus Nitrosotenuis aquarius TaxID=1846278 RepID=UPI000C1DDCA5|nr:1-(5-phosphoribosyl)-5-[(5-phosphoribosylamino)methylideneamino]imidazole-4-carboxamide isomerase [Candidatus Nitrosotenuis aquarius]
MKIIPAIDIMDGQVVRLVQGKPENKTVYSNNPGEIAKKWEKQGADMLHIVDLDATLKLGSNLELIQRIVKEISIPVQIAGGLRDENVISSTLDFADRVVIGTLAFKDRELVNKLGSKLGHKNLVISADHNNGNVVINGWTQKTKTNLVDAVQEFSNNGFTEFLITNVSRDGMLQGPDLENLALACKQNVNVIASGGISKPSDVSDVKQCNAYGVILGKALYEGKITIEEAKKLA